MGLLQAQADILVQQSCVYGNNHVFPMLNWYPSLAAFGLETTLIAALIEQLSDQSSEKILSTKSLLILFFYVYMWAVYKPSNLNPLAMLGQEDV